MIQSDNKSRLLQDGFVVYTNCQWNFIPFMDVCCRIIQQSIFYIKNQFFANVLVSNALFNLLYSGTTSVVHESIKIHVQSKTN